MTRSEGKKLDKFWSEAIHRLSEVCMFCLEGGIRLEAAHIIGRSHRTTRWGCMVDGKYDLAGMLLCHGCHRAYDQHLPEEGMIRRILIGEERYEKLRTLSRVIAKNQSYEEIRALLTKGG